MSKTKPGDYDEHIVTALLKLDNPIIGKDGKKFYIRDKARNESGLEHIAVKRHRLKVRDIESITSILKHPAYTKQDPSNRNYINYYGIRQNTKNYYLIKIVTWPNKDNPNEETIITIYPVKNVK